MRSLLSRVPTRSDLSAMVDWIEPGTTVLDLGCGDGELLDILRREKNVRGMGVDIDQHLIEACIRRGIPVIQKDLDEPLTDFQDGAYDYVIVSQTIHQLPHPDRLMEEVLRIGRRAVVSFPNFGHWRPRLQLLFSGRMPKTPSLPFEWYRSPNIHLMTIADFKDFCAARQIRLLRRVDISGRGLRPHPFLANLLTEAVVVLLGR
jgi:methionine biosynthesis protein MetW